MDYPMKPSDACPGETSCTDLEIPNRPAEPSQEPGGSTTHVPLLLNPAYSRTKSMAHDELRNFRISLKWCALDHSSCTGKIISYAAFVVLALLIPAVTSFAVTSFTVTNNANSTTGGSINKLVQLPESGLAAISFFTLSGFFQRYGLRQLLFLDGGLRDDSAYVRRGYARELDRAFKCLTYILLPSFSVELAHKILIYYFSEATVSVAYARTRLPWSSIAFAAALASWVYRTGVFLLVCALFRLTCELQILRFEGFRKLLEGCGSLDAAAIFKEHVRIKRQLLVTSHRYRIFIIGCFVTITVCQLGALMVVLASKSQKNFCNSGDLLVCSAVQLSGFFMCLLGAARITHRAQGVVSIATRWHMIATTCAVKNCGSQVNTQQLATSTHLTNDLRAPPNGAAAAADSKLSSESLAVFPRQDNFAIESRKALVKYLQHNNGGITLFGFALDRGLLHTLFAFEMSLVLWILSKAVVLS